MKKVITPGGWNIKFFELRATEGRKNIKWLNNHKFSFPKLVVRTITCSITYDETFLKLNFLYYLDFTCRNRSKIWENKFHYAENINHFQYQILISSNGIFICLFLMCFDSLQIGYFIKELDRKHDILRKWSPLNVMLLIYLLGGKHTVIVFLLWLLRETLENEKYIFRFQTEFTWILLFHLFWVIFRCKRRSQNFNNSCWEKMQKIE